MIPRCTTFLWLQFDCSINLYLPFRKMEMDGESCFMIHRFGTVGLLTCSCQGPLVFAATLQSENATVNLRRDYNEGYD